MVTLQAQGSELGEVWGAMAQQGWGQGLEEGRGPNAIRMGRSTHPDLPSLGTYP